MLVRQRALPADRRTPAEPGGGADGGRYFHDSADLGSRKPIYLRRFRLFAPGAPSYDHLVDILAMPDA